MVVGLRRNESAYSLLRAADDSHALHYAERGRVIQYLAARRHEQLHGTRLVGLGAVSME